MSGERPGLDEAVEAAGRSLFEFVMSRDRRDSELKWRDATPEQRADWTAQATHIAEAIGESVAAAVRADERQRVLAEVDAAIVAERDKLVQGNVRAGVNAARLAVRALTGTAP